MKLRHKIAFFVVLLLTVLISAVVIRSAKAGMDAAEEAMSSYARMTAKTIAGKWISDIIAVKKEGGLSSRPSVRKEMEGFIGVVMSMDRKIASIVVSDGQGRVIAGNINPDWVEYDATEAEALEWIISKGIERGGFKSVSVDISTDDARMGNVKIIFSLSDLKKEIFSSALKWLFLGLGFVSVGIIGAFFISNRITRPLGKVVNAMARVEEGDLAQKVETSASDEVGKMALQFNKMVEGLREREFIKETFSKYVSKQVAARILKDGDYKKLKGERRVVTVLFADMRGFTAMASALPPEEVMEMLNEYFSIMIDIVFKYGGMLDKFIGDAIMAVYNAPLDQRQHELCAIMTGLDIQEQVAGINAKRLSEGKEQINVGIGINTGEAVAGNIGSSERLEYTVIGSGVNLAQRIESFTKKGQLLISETTYEAVRSFVEVIKLEPTTVKGISEPVELYAVLKAKPPEDFHETYY